MIINYCGGLARPCAPLLSFCCKRFKRMAAAGDSLYRVIFVLGGPGAGKGTQCEKIVKHFGYQHLSAGELLRIEMKSGSTLAEQITGHMTAGSIVPVAITCSLLEKAMQNAAPVNHFLIDGFPRNEDNFQGWQSQMGSKTLLQAVLVFSCADDICVERCVSRGAAGSGRLDDNVETLKRRLTQFKTETQPVIDHYSKDGLVHVIDASPDPDSIFLEVEKIIKGLPK